MCDDVQVDSQYNLCGEGVCSICADEYWTLSDKRKNELREKALKKKGKRENSTKG